jgi:dipeptidyl aminopeptidase/acylaminoacyl peptidase
VEIDPAWSRDGTRLAYACDRGGNMDVWVHDFRNGTDVQITRERGPVSGVSWSPDGQDIAFLVNRSDLHIVSLANGGRRPQSPSIIGSRDRGRLTWPADGKRVARDERLVSVCRPVRHQHQPTPAPFSGHGLGIGSDTRLAPFGRQSRQQRPGVVTRRFASDLCHRRKLWVVGIGTNGGPQGDASLVTDDLPDSPSWQGDSRHVSISPREDSGVCRPTAERLSRSR